MQLGLHFRLDDAEAARVLEAAGDDDALHEVLGALEEDEAVFARACETDKAWDPIACAIAPAGEDDEWPARGVIGGARDLQVEDESWVTHLSPAETAEVAGFLVRLTDEDFVRHYREMPLELRNPEFGPDEQGYALENLQELRGFFTAAASEGRHVVFTVWL